MSNENLRVRCRNQQCRTKLEVPTDNHHKAFCKPFCHATFYMRRCLVCERDLPKGYRRQLCSARQCRIDYRNFRHSYVLDVPSAPNCRGDARNPCGTRGKIGLKAPPGSRIIAGPPLSDFSLWAATLDPPRPQKPADKSWRLDRQPGDLAAEWTARELARREADDAEYVARDEQRLQTEPLDASGNYQPQETKP